MIQTNDMQIGPEPFDAAWLALPPIGERCSLGAVRGRALRA